MTELGLGDRIERGRHDLFYLGGGQDRDQAVVADDMVATKAEGLHAAVADGAAVVCVCGGFQLAGHGYTGTDGSRMPGVGILDLDTVAGPTRLIGDLVIEADLDGERHRLVGFENHAGRTRLGAGCRPLGRVVSGHGNNGERRRRGRRLGPRPGHLPPRAAAAEEPVAGGPPHRLGARPRHRDGAATGAAGRLPGGRRPRRRDDPGHESAEPVSPRRVGILAFEGVDLLDLGGPYEVFLTASRLAVRDGEPPPFEVIVIGPGSGPVHAYGGLAIVPHVAADAVDRLDVLIVPGAIAIDEVAADPETAGAVRRLLGVAELPASVCTGAFLLADAGVLGDRPWTTHWEDVAALAARLGSTRGRPGVPWVNAGDVDHLRRPQLGNRDGPPPGGPAHGPGPRGADGSPARLRLGGGAGLSRRRLTRRAEASGAPSVRGRQLGGLHRA